MAAALAVALLPAAASGTLPGAPAGAAMAIPGTPATTAGGLVLAARDIRWLEGEYSVDGRNPNGTPYRGRVFITVRGDDVYFRWEIGRDVYRGEGGFVGNVLVIDWGQADPVTYVVNTDGTLNGTWSKGLASERLIPR
ncbi:hypothetical protein D1F64_01895 [Breoghania sp. L-A4]|nr:hypothetical protein D1F64_01895 [Breoghania sp. L-A4]